MSNQITSIAVLRVFVTLFGSTTLLLGSSGVFAQSEGFSIFEQTVEEVAEKAVERVTQNVIPTVSPQEAFTNPAATLPKSQFGSFGNTNGSIATGTPKLSGAKAIGTYAIGAAESSNLSSSPEMGNGKLKPFAPNALRPQLKPPAQAQAQASNPVASIAAAPVTNDPNARRLGAAAADASSKRNSDAAPRVAQVAFQDGGFNTRFGTGGQTNPPTNRFQAGSGQNAANPSRFGFGGSRSAPTPGEASSTPPITPRSNTPSPTANPFQQAAPRTSQSQPPPAKGFSSETPRRGFPKQPNNSTRLGAANPATQDAPRSRQTGFATTSREPDRGQSQTRNPQRSHQQPASRNAMERARDPQSNSRQANAADEGRARTNPDSAKELLRSWVAIDSEQELPGKRMKLYEFLGQPINGSKKDAINQYWVTFSDMARYQMALQQTQWLKSISKPRQGSEQAILAAAQQAAQNRVLHSEIQLAKSQAILSDFFPNLRRNGKHVAVVPANIPWVGKLNTKFDEYQRRGMVPARFGTIDDYLPKARTLIANEAAAVVASEKAANQARSAMKSGQISVASVLEAVRIKERNEEEFLAAVLGYNRAITDYVLSVRQDIYQPKRLASVLIGRKSVEPTPATASRPQEDPAGTSSDFPQLDRSSRSSNSLRSQNEFDERGLDRGLNRERGPDLAARGNRNNRDSQQPTRVASKQSVEYGPTADSAVAANYDPSNVQEELPMQQIKPQSNSDSYSGNDRASGGNRTAAAPANSRTKQPLRTQLAAPSRGKGLPRASGGFSGASTGQGAANSAPSIPRNGGAGAATRNPFKGAAGSAPAAAPRVGSFAGGAAAPPAAVGGGTFGGGIATPSVPTTASGTSASGFSTRR